MNAAVDNSGYAVFSQGQCGTAHVASHRFLDSGKLEEGYRWLSRWMNEVEQDSATSDGCHLHFHLLIFEIATGRLPEARKRARDHLCRWARDTDRVATDAPAALCRLGLAGLELPRSAWSEVHAGAARRLAPSLRGKAPSLRGRASSSGDNPYARLHDLLSLFGAGDALRLRRFADLMRPRDEGDQTLLQFARAFENLVIGRPQVSAEFFHEALPGLSELGGSRAQNEMFFELSKRASHSSITANQ